MARALEEEFRRWVASRPSPPSLELQRADEESGGLVLSVRRRSDGVALATVSLVPVEGASFFVEGLDDPPEEVEDWLTSANSFFSEKPRLALGEALEALLSTAPGSATGSRPSVKRAKEHVDEDEEDDEDDGLVLDDGSDEDAEAQAMEVTAVEVAADREAERAAFSEDMRWNDMVTSSASQGSRQASQVLMREMRNLMALRGDGDRKALEIEMVDDSLYRWVVKMHARGFPDDCRLKAELTKFGAEHPSGVGAVVMDVHFPNSYPMEPPFIRIVRPRFLMHTGHVTIGGSICMQLLTPSGWLPTVSLENVFVSIRSEMIEGGGRIDFSASGKGDYTVAEAKEAFKRVASRYGWLAK